MGIEEVYTVLRELEVATGWNTDDLDIGHAVMHHTNDPASNYCTVEFKMPSLEKQMLESHAREIEDTYHYPGMHRMKFDQVENMGFHRFMDKEGRSTIHKVRRYEGNHVTTYYFSATRRLGLLKHDYPMAMLVYLNYPERMFTRRKPCTDLDPDCIPGCMDTLREPIVHWLNDPEPNTARLDKFFFSYVAEPHRLCIGYTIEDIKDHDTCFEPKEPDYFVLDLEAKYFKEAIWGKTEWETEIIKERSEVDHEMFCIYDRGPDDRHDGEGLSYSAVQFQGYGGAAYLVKYNLNTMENVPKPLVDALETNNFAALWRFDMETLNARNSIHKWTFNHWNWICTNNERGWWCSWSVAETISGAGDAAAGLGDGSGQVASQLNQVANVVGWGSSNDTSSPDTEYNQVRPKYNGYTYITHLEALPDRDTSMF